MRFRTGSDVDVPIILDLFDEAVAWMVSQGNTGQWGTEPWSSQPDRVARVVGLVEQVGIVGMGTVIAEVADIPVGVLITSDQPTIHVEPADEPELYVRLLLTARRQAGSGIGSALLDIARKQARDRGVSLLRVDCYAGGTGDLIRYYERNGFVRTGTFTVQEWPGQVFEQRV